MVVSLAVLGLISANPAFAANATRSADALPHAAAGAATIAPARASAACAPVASDTGAAESAGYLRCAERGVAPAGGDYAGFLGSSGGFPLAILLLVLAAGGAVALGSGGGNDSPG